MSVRVDLPNLRAESFLNDGSLRRLRAAAFGADRSFPRGRAMVVLTEQPGGDGDLQAILEDEKQPSRFRALAATLLWRLGSRAGQDVLVRSASSRDEQVLSAVMTALGRIGDQRALEVVRAAAGYATGTAAKQARFAAMLIEHRLGLAEGDVPATDQTPLEPLDASGRPFEVLRPASEESAIARRSLAQEPFGIEYASRAHQIRCERNVWMLLFNRELASLGNRRLVERKALAGVVASRNEPKRTYSIRFVILTSPAGGDRVRVSGFTTLGDPAFAGDASVRESRVEFTVAALSRPGAFPFRLDADWQADRVEVRRAVTAVFVQKRRQPSQGIRPAK